MQPKTLISAEANKLLYQNYFQLLEWHTIVYSIFSQVWLALSLCHLILVKICYKLLYVIQGVENSFGKVTSWPELISEFWSHMPVNNVAFDGPHTLLHPRCFCLAYIIHIHTYKLLNWSQTVIAKNPLIYVKHCITYVHIISKHCILEP